MKRILVTALHRDGGEPYNWLLPTKLEDEFLKTLRNSNFNGTSVLALVENYDSCKVVKIIDYKLTKINNKNLNEMPFKKVVKVWEGIVDDFIFNYCNREFCFLDDLDDLISKLTKEDKEKLVIKIMNEKKEFSSSDLPFI